MRREHEMRERQQQAHPDHRDHHDGQRQARDRRVGHDQPADQERAGAERQEAQDLETEPAEGVAELGGEAVRARLQAGAPPAGQQPVEQILEPEAGRDRHDPRQDREHRREAAGPRELDPPGRDQPRDLARGHHGVVEPVDRQRDAAGGVVFPRRRLVRHDDRLRQSSERFHEPIPLLGLRSAGRVMTIAPSAPSAAATVSARTDRQTTTTRAVRIRRAMDDIVLSRAPQKDRLSKIGIDPGAVRLGRQPYTVRVANPSACPPLAAPGWQAAAAVAGRAEAAAIGPCASRLMRSDEHRTSRMC